MAIWPVVPVWKNPSEINDGNQYNVSDGVTAEDMNNIIEDLIYLKENGGPTADIQPVKEYSIDHNTDGEPIVIEPDGNYDAMRKVSLSVNVPTPVPTLVPKTFKANGTYEAASYGADGFDQVTVDVSSAPELVAGAATPTKERQDIAPPAGKNGFSSFTVYAIPSQYVVPEGTKSITENGVYDVTDKAQVNVNVESQEAVLEPLEITSIRASGDTIYPSGGKDGFDSVTYPAGYVKPAGTKSITENGTYDVSGYANASVNVSTGFANVTVTENDDGTVDLVITS